MLTAAVSSNVDTRRVESAYRLVASRMEAKNMDPTRVDVLTILGSGLNAYATNCLSGLGDGGVVKIPFNEVWAEVNVTGRAGTVNGHDRNVVIGQIKGSSNEGLVMALAGREHMYEDIAADRAAFFVRLGQRFGVKAAIISNAAGIVTPKTLSPLDIMLVHAHLEQDTSGVLRGGHIPGWGTRFPHMGDLYSARLRRLAQAKAAELGFKLVNGVYVRKLGPQYEQKIEVYQLRKEIQQIYEEARLQAGEADFNEDPACGVGMSSTPEALAAQDASQAFDEASSDTLPQYPAYEEGILMLTALTNYAAGLGPNGMVAPPTHAEVQENGRLMACKFEPLVTGIIETLRTERAMKSSK